METSLFPDGNGDVTNEMSYQVFSPKQCGVLPFFPVFFLLSPFSHCLTDVPVAGLVHRPFPCRWEAGELETSVHQELLQGLCWGTFACPEVRGYLILSPNPLLQLL